jgi:hypothetical protein
MTPLMIDGKHKESNEVEEESFVHSLFQEWEEERMMLEEESSIYEGGDEESKIESEPEGIKKSLFKGLNSRVSNVT